MSEGSHSQVEPRFYQQWLGISVECCPPNHYQLLGLPLFEADRQVISQAAQRRAVVVRRFQAGEHAQVARLIVHQLARAKACLTDSTAKFAYDTGLRNASSASPSASSRLVDEDLLLVPLESEDHASLSKQPTATSSHTEVLDDDLPILSPLAATVDEMMIAAALPPQRITDPMALRAAVQRSKANRDAPRLVFVIGGAVAATIIVSLFIYRWSQSDGNAGADQASRSQASSTASDEGQRQYPVSGRKVKSSDRKDPDRSDASTPNPDSASGSDDENPNSSIPTTVADFNPFSRLVTEIDLPTIDTQAPEDEQPQVSLGPLALDPSSDWELTLEDQATSKSTYDFEVRSTPGGLESSGWDIIAVAKDGAAGPRSALGEQARDANRPVAILMIEHQQLNFRWNFSVESTLEKQLRMCDLQLVAGSHRHSIRLRALPVIPAIVLDLEQEKMTVPVPTHVHGMPDDAYIEVLSLEGARSSYSTTPNDRKAHIGKQVRVQLEPGEAEIRVGLVRSSNGLNILVSAFYEVRGQEYEFTATRLNDHLQGLQRKLGDSQALMAESQRLTNVIPIRIRELERTAEQRNGAGQTAALLEISQLRANLKTAEANIRRLSRSIPIAVNDVRSVNEAANLAQQLHKRAELRLRVVASSEQGDVPILLAGGDNDRENLPAGGGFPGEPQNDASDVANPLGGRRAFPGGLPRP